MGSNWVVALEYVGQRLNDVGVTWMLVGSAATAVHGVRVTPGDVDVLLRTQADLETAADALPSQQTNGVEGLDNWLSSQEQPLMRFGDSERWTFGRWFIADTKVELAHILKPGPPRLLSETAGEEVWQKKLALAWRGIEVAIVPLEVQIATMLLREQGERLRAVRKAIDSGIDIEGELLGMAIAGREAETGAVIHRPGWVDGLLMGFPRVL